MCVCVCVCVSFTGNREQVFQNKFSACVCVSVLVLGKTSRLGYLGTCPCPWLDTEATTEAGNLISHTNVPVHALLLFRSFAALFLDVEYDDNGSFMDVNSMG